MFLLFQLCLFFLNNIFAGNPYDATVFLLFPEDYYRNGKINESINFGSTFVGDISSFYYSQPSLLSKKKIDIFYIQQVLDLALGLTINDYLLAKTVFRSRILWGSNEEGLIVQDSSLFLLKLKTDDHKHDINKSFFWLREGWIALDISRFMGITKSLSFQIGSIPFELGRGISFGQAYLIGNGFLGLDSSNIIDEFPPGFLLSGEIYSNKKSSLTADFYCAIINNNSINYEEIIEPIYNNRIQNCSNSKLRGFGHINAANIFKLKYSLNHNWGVFQCEPYILYNINPESNLEFKFQGKSNLITLGCMIEGDGDLFNFNIEWAINKGGLHVYGLDRNSLTLDSRDSFYKINNSNVFDNDKLALDTLVNSVIIENSPQGKEFNGKNISANLKNSKVRFQDPKYINYNGAMFVADFAYWLKKEKLLIAATCGFATGGDDPIYNYKDDSFAGFLGIQQLYTGLWVQTSFGMGGPLSRMLEQDYSLDNPYNSSLALFTNLKFLGISIRLDSFEWPWVAQLNILSFWSFCADKEFDFKLLKTINKEVPSFLGTELFFYFTYQFFQEIVGYFSYSIFFIGGRFINDHLGPLDELDQYYFPNISLPDKTSFNNVCLLNFGFSYYF